MHWYNGPAFVLIIEWPCVDIMFLEWLCVCYCGLVFYYGLSFDLCVWYKALSGSALDTLWTSPAFDIMLWNGYPALRHIYVGNALRYRYIYWNALRYICILNALRHIYVGNALRYRYILECFVLYLYFECSASHIYVGNALRYRYILECSALYLYLEWLRFIETRNASALAILCWYVLWMAAFYRYWECLCAIFWITSAGGTLHSISMILTFYQCLWDILLITSACYLWRRILCSYWFDSWAFCYDLCLYF